MKTLQRYFINHSQINDGYVTLTDDAAKHIRRVMRMTTGDKVICCTDGGQCYLSELTSLTEDSVQGRIISQENKQVELPIHVTIAQGLPKGDKLELVIQKGTELGAFSFLPFEAERSVVKWDSKKAGKKVERWNKIAMEAAEQSHRQILPKVRDVQKFTELLKQFEGYNYVLVAYEEAAKNDEKSHFFSILEKVKHGDSLLFVFGPEGGFSDREIEEMTQVGAIPCGLGPRILRSETAPLYGLSAISYHLELMG